MIKTGDKVAVVIGDYSGMKDGEILTVFFVQHHNRGFWARQATGIEWYVKTEDMAGSATIIVKPHTEIEAEKRGAKFGVTGVVKKTGERIVFQKEENKCWRVLPENSLGIDVYQPECIRLDHEPEYVPWLDAPEHLRYDASRVYYDGKPVKWISKPEGAFVDAAFVIDTGMMEFSTSRLTVKL